MRPGQRGRGGPPVRRRRALLLGPGAVHPVGQRARPGQVRPGRRFLVEPARSPRRLLEATTPRLGGGGGGGDSLLRGSEQGLFEGRDAGRGLGGLDGDGQVRRGAADGRGQEPRDLGLGGIRGGGAGGRGRGRGRGPERGLGLLGADVVAAEVLPFFLELAELHVAGYCLCARFVVSP